MPKKFIVANWKMLPTTLAEAQELLESVNEHLEMLGEQREFSLIFCPPFVFIEEVAKMLAAGHLKHMAELGAQDISPQDQGALTGEVSGPMLSRLGVRYVIVGHSERRWKLGESDEVVNAKLKAALRNELVPIVCVGERTRDAGYENFLREQTKKTFEGLSPDEVARCLIAYEPVWAISTTPDARPDTPENALESMNIIRDVLSSRFQLLGPLFLYGGSVTAENAEAFLAPRDINGVLVGGASVNKKEFVKIIAVVARLP